MYRSKQVQVAWNQINGFVPKSGNSTDHDDPTGTVRFTREPMKDLNDKASLNNQVPTHHGAQFGIPKTYKLFSENFLLLLKDILLKIGKLYKNYMQLPIYT